MLLKIILSKYITDIVSLAKLKSVVSTNLK
jgi:hypothetical protein